MWLNVSMNCGFQHRKEQTIKSNSWYIHTKLLTYLNATSDTEAQLIPYIKPHGFNNKTCEEVWVFSYCIIGHACPLFQFTYFHKSGHNKCWTFSIEISTDEAIEKNVDIFLIEMADYKLLLLEMYFIVLWVSLR